MQGQYLYNNGGIHMNKKIRFSLEELTKKNKEELLKDKIQMEKIEKRIDEKHAKTKWRNPLIRKEEFAM